MSDLVAFLTARLDEDEADAWDRHTGRCASGGPVPFPCDCGVPARVLREVEAKRKILAECYDGNTYGPERNALAHDVARVLAAVYSGHPDYDPAWA